METNYPIVRLRRERGEGKRIKGRKPYFPPKFSNKDQAKRLGAGFEGAARSVAAWEENVGISQDPHAVVPERALVFELIGPVSEFEKAAQDFGFEWLVSDSKRREDAESGDESDDEEGESAAGDRGVLYLTMPSLQALHSLLAMWNRFKDEKPPGQEEKVFWAMFGYLSDLRVWSAKDRVDPSVVRYIQALLTADPNRAVTVELDFWYRTEKQRRDGAIETLKQLLAEVKGELLDLVEIPEIRYQGALISIPAKVAQDISQQDGSLARFDDVMTIRPQAQYSSETLPPAAVAPTSFPSDKPTRRCITAILDGYPISAHQALDGRIDVHEVEVKSTDVPVSARDHGTAMASLVINGDLLEAGTSGLTRPVVVVPVLTGMAGREAIPNQKLAIGVIYRALNSLLENAADNDNLDHITVINHSLCDTNSPFVRRPSPWAALLDYYSHNHRLLFVISAGNIWGSFPVHDYPDLNAFKAETDDAKKQASILLAIEQAKATRGILSPAESVNNLTVGALHAESSMNPPHLATDPYPSLLMTNLASATGFGVNRCAKPDLVEQGGRFAAQVSNNANGYVEIHPAPATDFGLSVAAPSVSGALNNTRRTAGTSNSAALITRACNQIADAVEDTFEADGTDWLTRPTRGPILKALLSHGSDWGDLGPVLEASFPPSGKHQWSKRRDTITKFLGYGRPNLGRIISGAENRVTLLAEDEIVSDELHSYRIPMPDALFKTRDLRSITITLAWTTPIVPTTADYRGVTLKLVNEQGTKKFWHGVDRSGLYQPNASTTERGTLTHLRLDGRKQIKQALANGMLIGVQARALHPSQNTARTPYALAITLEMAQSQKTNLYVDVSTEVRSRSTVRATTRAKG